MTDVPNYLERDGLNDIKRRLWENEKTVVGMVTPPDDILDFIENLDEGIAGE